MLSKRVLIPIATVAVIAAGVYGVSRASADSTATGQKSLVQDIADTFKLDKTKVQGVFDQHRQQNQQDREAKYEQRLSQAVTDGKLTSAQKGLVLTEHKLLQAELDAAKNKTGADRRTATQQVRGEAQTWAQQNNIAVGWLLGGGGFMHGGGMMGGPGMMGARSSHDNDADDSGNSSPSPTTSPAPSPSPAS